MSDTEDGNGSSTTPAFRCLSLQELQQFCLGPNSRDRVLSLLQKTTAGELLQQAAAAADAVALQQHATTAAEKEAATKAAARAAATGDTEAAANPEKLLELLLQSIKRAFEIEELRDAILSQPEMRPLLAAAAASPLTAIRELLAQQLQQIAKRGDAGVEFLWKLELNRQLLVLLDDAETAVAVRAETALAAVCSAECAVRLVFEGAFFKELSRLALDGPETVCFRVLSPLIHGSVQRERFFAAACSAAAELLSRLQQLVANKVDPLLQATACELLSALVSVPWGLDFALKEHYPELVARLIAEEEDVMECQTMIRLLARLTIARPSEFERLFSLQDGVLRKIVEDCLSSSCKRKKEEGIECWSILCSKPESAAELAERLPSWTDCVAESVMDVEEVSVAALHAWVYVLKELKEPSRLPESMRKTVETKLASKLLECVLQRPFPEARQQCYELLKALTAFDAPMQMVFSSDKFRQLMLDSASDTEYEVKVAKHAFAGAACEAQGEWLREALDTSFWGEFSRYAKKGPFSTSSAARSLATAT